MRTGAHDIDAGERSLADDNALVAAVVAMATVCLFLAGAALWLRLPLAIAAAPALASSLGFAAAFVYGGLNRSDRRAERARAESEADLVWELQESVDHYRALIDTLGDFVVHRDTEGRILFANEAFARFCGRYSVDLAGKTFTELGISVEETDDSGNTGGTGTLALTIGNTTRWLSWTTVLTRHPGTGDVVRQAIGRDITDALHAKVDLIEAREKAVQASHAKSRFLASVSHEIRTPLNGIIGMAKLIADTELSPEQRTYTEAVTKSGTELLALIEDLLDFSRIEAGRFEPQREPTNLRELTENVIELLAPKAYDKGIGMSAHIARTIPETLDTDPRRLRQVLINLVGNAVKFTDSGGIFVRVGMASDAQGNDVVEIAIEDTGPGISKNDQLRIFAEFEQGDGTTTRRHGGAGLGLAISRPIVEALGGSIRVDSAPGCGATFTVTLPASGAARPDSDTLSMPLAGRDYLVVSRNATEARALAAQIADLGGKPAICVQGSAMKGWKGRSFAAVLMEADGEEFTGTDDLKAHAITAGQIVILLRSTDRARLMQLTADGFDAFLARPVRRKTLARILTQAAADKQKKQSKPRKTRAKKNAAGTRVLVAEDNEINALLVHVALSKAGYDVDIVGDGQTAVDRACTADAGYAVVLMDLHMPVMDGPEAIRHIRRHEEEQGLRPVPILALTADSQSETREAVLADGATGFLTKPVDPGELSRIIADARAA